MTTGRAILIGVGIVLLAGILYLVINFQRSEKEVADYVVPQLEFAQMQLTNLTTERADMQMNMIIDNPAPVGLDIDSLHYTISIEGNEVVKTTYPDPLKIEASDTTMVSLPLTIYYDKLQSVLDKLEEEGKDSVVYKINATIFTDVAVIPKDKFNLKVEKRMPLIRVPEITVTDIGIKNLNFSGAVVQVEAYVVNENVFPIGFDNMHYSFQLEDNETMEGHKQETVKIQVKDSATISIPVEVNFKEMGKGLIDLIREGGDLQYDFSLRTKMVSDAHMLEDSEIRLNATGKLKDLTKVAKEQMSEEK
jgi:LEA14-like dessication related protein